MARKNFLLNVNDGWPALNVTDIEWYLGTGKTDTDKIAIANRIQNNVAGDGWEQMLELFKNMDRALNAGGEIGTP